MNRFSMVLGLVVVSVGLWGCDAARLGAGSFKATAAVQLSSPWEGYDRIEIRSRNGGVELLRADVAEVEVSGERYVRGRTQAEADANLDKIEVYAGRHATESGALLVELRFPDELKRQSPGASLTVRVPESCPANVRTSNGKLSVRSMSDIVTLRTSNGAITIGDVAGKVQAYTSNGKVTAENVDGELSIETSNGPVQVERIVGPVQVESSNGGVHLAGVQGAVVARTSNARIEAHDVQGACRLDTSNGRIVAELNPAAGDEVDVDTSNGSIELKLPVGQAANLDLETSNGKVVVDLPDGQLSDVRSGKREFHARLNGGGSLWHASTSNGSIRVKAQ